MARLSKIRIKGYRSIHEECVIDVPQNAPLVLIGENNAGKSNIVRAIDIVLGEYWPGSRDVADHEFWGRDPKGTPIEIEVYFDDLHCDRNGPVESIFWVHSPADSDEPRFRGLTPETQEVYVSKALRQKCQAIIVSADRRLSYQLSYTSKSTLLSKLMRRFHGRLVDEPARVERLKAQFKAIIDIFSEVAEFKEFQEGLSERLGDALTGMTHGLSVDFSAYDPSNFFHALRVLPNEDGDARTFEELGTGQEQVLALVFAHAYARAFFGGIVLVIEEPEAHLHPLAQEWLARTIRTMAKDGLQVILTTHSPAFVDVLGMEGLALVRKVDGAATSARQLTAIDLADFCVAHGADPDRTDAETILPFYANAATPQILAGLFARKVVLVEGPTEAMSLPIYLLKAKLDVVRLGIAIVPVLGKGNLARWWRFFRAFDLPVYVIFDNDKGDDRKGEKRADLLNTLGCEDDIGLLLAEEGWLVTDQYSIFGVDFETTLRAQLSGYAQMEDQARQELGGDSKSLIAKYVADNLAIDPVSAGWKSLKQLAKSIRELGQL